ncbi:MAG: hypothetical protein NEHIOOID_01114 [Holosporales bacterium]
MRYKMKVIAMLLCLGITCCSDTKKSHFVKDGAPIMHPLTDNLHVDVYTFIGKFLEENTESLSKNEINRQIEVERENKGNADFKPLIAQMYEGEMAGLLRVLLLKNAQNENITLYGRDGIGKATSGMRSDSLSFANRPSDLNLGFLTPEILSKSYIYHYEHNNIFYEERIFPIFKKKHRYTLEKSAECIHIGYVSYIVRLP